MIRIPEHVVTTMFDDSAVLLDTRNDVYFALNETGGEFWSALAKGDTVDAAVAHVCDLFDAPREVIESDMRSLVRQLIDARLLLADGENA
ncbi:Coenzyme PQQ synthesis protein D (PqqD) [Nonomuraea solani]|uniref:Coenzyme PQQ synthesis protein D (PqqD) n=1 Tax=Nonomuraea solani TaxID=1144553 RepID=A0A1H6ETF1_9ACTN|nr:PqqD family protein [Nonomuraea solani]SEH00215.1 Coenzyme PQQ synthesis protein D (PqqD) [Nonomuraea solani]